jgi:hypothetical protein
MVFIDKFSIESKKSCGNGVIDFRHILVLNPCITLKRNVYALWFKPVALIFLVIARHEAISFHFYYFLRKVDYTHRLDFYL